MNRILRIVSVVVLLAVLVFAAWRTTVKRIEQDRANVSSDSLSEEIIARWNAGLPKDFTKIEVNDIDAEGKGYLFASLVYDEPIDELLLNWGKISDAQIAGFQEIVEAHLNDAAVSAEHKTLIEENRPVPDKGWIAYTMEGGENQQAKLILLYDYLTKTIYLAEMQP